MTIVLDEFIPVKDAVSTDDRGRVALGPTQKSASYMVARNAFGQILLTPVTSIPTHELWLHHNPAALAAVRQGVAEAKSGLGTVVDYSQYADIEIED